MACVYHYVSRYKILVLSDRAVRLPRISNVFFKELVISFEVLTVYLLPV
jgi:hypothetical protein